MASGIAGLIRLLIPGPGACSEEILEYPKHKHLFTQIQYQFAANRQPVCGIVQFVREIRA
jgi:hypothetical protein